MAYIGRNVTTEGADTATHTMRAVVQDGYGSAEVLRLSEVPRPTAGAGEVLVRVRAAGLDRGVWHAMTGLPYAARLAFGVRRPRRGVPGFDVAGTVADMGPGVTGFALAEEVYGFGSGTFAEFALVPADQLAHKPANLAFEQAAVVPVCGVTALIALRDRGVLRPGQRVLVIGASGGVGTYAVQLAAAMGGKVTGVCSPGKADLVRSLGAEVIDYTAEDFADGVRHWDLVLDIGGSSSVKRLRRALAPSGTVVIVGGENGGSLIGGVSRQLTARATSPFVGQRLTAMLATVRAADLRVLTSFIEAGTVKPVLDRTYPLEQVADAMQRLIDGDVRGKVAVAL